MKRIFATALAIVGVTSAIAAQAQGPVRGPMPLPRVVEELPQGNLTNVVHFYHDLLGLEAMYDPRVYLQWWGVGPFLKDMYGVGGRVRNIHLLVPGAAFQIEADDWSDHKGKLLNPRLQDTGASLLVLHVRDIDRLFGYLKQGNTKVVTTGGAPVAVADASGGGRAVVVQDPNGFFVELIQPATLPPSGTHGPDDNGGPGPGPPPPRPLPFIYGADVTVTVDDLDKGAQFFRDVFGLNVRVDNAAHADAKHMQLFGMKGAQYREAAIAWPDKTPRLNLIQFTDIAHRTLTPLVADPGATMIRIYVRDMDSILAKVKAIPDAKIMNLSGTPTTPEMRYDHAPWLIVRVPGSSTYLQLCLRGG